MFRGYQCLVFDAELQLYDLPRHTTFKGVSLGSHPQIRQADPQGALFPRCAT